MALIAHVDLGDFLLQSDPPVPHMRQLKEDADHNIARIKLLNGSKPNDLLRAMVGQMEIHAFNEVIPSMSDIFIKTVGGKAEEEMVGSKMTE